MKKIKENIGSMLNRKYELKWIMIGFFLGDIISELIKHLLNQLF